MEENDTEAFVPKKNGTEPGLNWTSLFLLLILLTLVAFGAFYFGKGKKEVPISSPTPQVEITSTPEATAPATIPPSASPSASPSI